MKINPISVCNQVNLLKKNQSVLLKKEQNISFKGPGGGTFGFMVGGAAGLALTAMALTTPVGWIAAAAFYGGTAAGAAGGAYIGHKLGDLIDPNDKK